MEQGAQLFSEKYISTQVQHFKKLESELCYIFDINELEFNLKVNEWLFKPLDYIQSYLVQDRNILNEELYSSLLESNLLTGYLKAQLLVNIEIVFREMFSGEEIKPGKEVEAWETFEQFVRQFCIPKQFTIELIEESLPNPNEDDFSQNKRIAKQNSNSQTIQVLSKNKPAPKHGKRHHFRFLVSHYLYFCGIRDTNLTSTSEVGDRIAIDNWLRKNSRAKKKLSNHSLQELEILHRDIKGAAFNYFKNIH